MHSGRHDETSPLIYASYARMAGLLYLIIIVCGIFAEGYVRGSLVVAGDGAATAANISASPGLFRIGFAADAIMLLSDIAIAVLFYVLLKPVSRNVALAAAVFRLAQAAILAFNLLNYYAAQLLLGGAAYGLSFEAPQLQALMMLFLELHSHGYDLGLLFFGVSNILLGYLLVRSDYFPRVLGYGLIAAALVYLLGSFTRFLLPDINALITPLYLVPLLVELAFSLWLLLKGVRLRPEMA